MRLQVGVKALISQDDKYLFLRRSHYFKPGPENWDIPGGRIAPEESLKDALRREVKEETSMNIISIDELLAAQDIFVADKDLHVVRLTYKANAIGDVVVSDEHSDQKWMSKQDLLAEEHVDSYLRKVIMELL